MIELVVSDLDGTLWHGDGIMPLATRRAVAELERRQIPLLAATSRRSFTVATYFDRLELDLLALLLNGALGRQRSPRSVFYERPFTPTEAIGVLDAFHRHAVFPCVNFETEAWDIVAGPSLSAGTVYLESAGVRLRRVADLAVMCGSMPVYGFSVVAADDDELLRRVSHEFEMDGQSLFLAVTRGLVAGRWWFHHRRSRNGAASKPSPIFMEWTWGRCLPSVTATTT